RGLEQSPTRRLPREQLPEDPVTGVPEVRIPAGRIPKAAFASRTRVTSRTPPASRPRASLRVSSFRPHRYPGAPMSTLSQAVQAAILAAGLAAAAGASHAQEPTVTDPYLWLEDVEGEKALDWVKARNAVTEAELTASPGFKQLEM